MNARIINGGFFVTLFLLVPLTIAWTQNLEHIVVNPKDPFSGEYYYVKPATDSIAGILVLLAGYGQRADATPPETKIHHEAAKKHWLTVFYAAGNKLYADSITQTNLTVVIEDIQQRFLAGTKPFVLGGFSAGGMIALRYAELCNQFPDRFPIQAKAVFMVDSPIDVFTLYELLEEIVSDNYSDLAVAEAESAMQQMKREYGVPREQVQIYRSLSAFCMDAENCDHEKFLVNTAVRAYHDVDIAWRIIHRHQTVHNSNYEVTAELINRLRWMGNAQAEFIQSFQKGYRANGQRHPHSWSIVDEKELVQWLQKLIA